jgi:hypothetical protein
MDARAGPRRRRSIVAKLTRRARDDERRWDDVEAALGSIPHSDTRGAADDCHIAAAAVGIGGVLVTGNPKDFPVGGLTVEHGPVGE